MAIRDLSGHDAALAPRGRNWASLHTAGKTPKVHLGPVERLSEVWELFECNFGCPETQVWVKTLSLSLRLRDARASAPRFPSSVCQAYVKYLLSICQVTVRWLLRYSKVGLSPGHERQFQGNPGRPARQVAAVAPGAVPRIYRGTPPAWSHVPRHLGNTRGEMPDPGVCQRGS